ncbi:MAG: DUF3343 domain-containing protein [Thermodesulfobacteriota bacterium]
MKYRKEYLITFGSTYRALKAEKTLKGRGIEFRLVPTPGKLISGCGLSIAFDDENRILVVEALREEGVKIKASFIKMEKDYIETSLS